MNQVLHLLEGGSCSLLFDSVSWGASTIIILVKVRFHPIWNLRISTLIVIIDIVLKCLVTVTPGVLSWNVAEDILRLFGRAVGGACNTDLNVIDLLLWAAFSLELPVLFWRTLFSLADKHYFLS